MSARGASLSNTQRWAGLLVILALLGATTEFVPAGEKVAAREANRKPRIIGSDRLVSWESLPEMDGQICPWAPVGATATLVAFRQQMSGSGSGSRQGAGDGRPTDAEKTEAAKRAPVRVMRDPYAAYAGIVVDPIRDEVLMTDENLFSILVYDRRGNTPPTAKMTEPKRMIQGSQTMLEFQCSLYVDPANGDIYGVNNDTVDTLVVFNRDAKGNVPPTRKLETPHTTFGIAVDEEQQEMFLTVQDDHAVVVFKKTARDADSPLRTIQGPSTQLADPHGIALDSKTGLLFVSNWGSTNERVAPDPSQPRLGRTARPNWPVGRDYTIPSSGKFLAPSIAVFPKDAGGDTPPLRVIQGPKTQLNWPAALAVHPEREELYVANDTGDSVLVFRAEANGNVAPIRIIRGPRTLIDNPTGVSLDLKNEELWVANFGNHTATVYPTTADGDRAPLRVIRSGPLTAPSPLLGNPHTVAFDTKRDEILVAN